VSNRTATGGAGRALALLGVAAVGVLGGHELGYLLGGATSTTPHGHLEAALHAAPLFAAWLLVAAAVTDPRRGWTRALTFPRLAALQVTLYGGLEVGERLVLGMPLAELTSTPVLLGLLSQLLLAGVTIALARLAQALVERILLRWSEAARLRVPTSFAAPAPRAVRSQRPLTTSSRGPPAGPLAPAV
jgi:hypothetical protein